jgi:cobalt-zinc-cadmium efflux system membrane fusion protein
MSTHLQADAAVTQARATLVKAQADADRAKDLFDHNAVAKKELLSAENALAQAQAALDQALAAREQAERRLAVLGLSPRNFKQQVVVRSPLSGKVLELSVVPGEYRNDTSAPVMTIADLSTVWVSSQVPETYIRFIQPNEQVEIRLVAYPDETFEGHVLRIADTVDPQTRTVKVHAEMQNPHGRFRPEMFGSIHHIESMARMPVVPTGAVIEGDGRTTVFVESAPGTFEERTVVVGKKAGPMVRIVSGLKAGDVVVVDGAMLLSGLMRKPA